MTSSSPLTRRALMTRSLALGWVRDGWLNRLLKEIPGVQSDTAYAIGRGDMLLLKGAAEVANWAPDSALALSPQARRLLDLVMYDDPLLRDAMAEAVELSQGTITALTGGEEMDNAMMMDTMQDMMRPQRGADSAETIARFAAERLRGESRIAAFSLSGFDTHARQDVSLRRALDRLQTAILTLRGDLGDVWQKTAVVAMTEFGRTVQVNGTKGTDHGTGGAKILAGGALRGGRVLGDWPGLTEADLYKRRDLMPTQDVRAYAGWIMRDLFELSPGVIERTVFPGVDLGRDPRLIV